MGSLRMFQRVTETTDLLSVAAVRDHCRIDDDCDDLLLSSYIKAAREYAENHTRRIIGSQEYRLVMSDFCDVELKSPLVSVESITYFDSDNTEQTLPAEYYYIDTLSTPGAVSLNYGFTYPDTYRRNDAVTINFTAGDTPETVKHAMLMLIGHWYENRESVNIGNIVSEMPLAVEALLYPYRVYDL